MLKFIKNTQNLANGHLKLIEYYPFEGILRERLFEGNILLAETYCYNLSGRQDSNLRPSAPKALETPKRALRFQAISIFLRTLAKFVLTNKPSYDMNMP